MAQRTIVIRTTPEGPLRKEAISDAALQPGQLVEWSGDGTVGVLSATICPSVKVVIESGTTPVSGTYASGDQIPFVCPRPGDEFYAWLDGTQTITINEVLQSVGNGRLGALAPLDLEVVTVAVSASLTTGFDGTQAADGTNNAIHFTAIDAGQAGNGISIDYVDGTADAGGISVIGNDITCEVGTAVASDLVTLLNANTSVAQLVLAATLGVSDGVVEETNDGTLSGGADVGEISSGAGDLETAIRASGLARAIEAVSTTSAIAQIKVEAI